MSETPAKLIVVGGPLDGHELALDEGTERTLGSDADCAPRLELSNVAPHHARMGWKAGMLVLADLGSATGTFVNGEQLVGERELSEGDRICLGPPGSSQTAKILVRLAPRAASAPHTLAVTSSASPDVLHFGDAEPVALVPVPDSDLGLEGIAAPPTPDRAAFPDTPAFAPSALAEPEIVVSESEVAAEPAAVASEEDHAAAFAAAIAPSVVPARVQQDARPAPPAATGQNRARPRPAYAPAARRPVARPRRARVPRIAILGIGIALALAAAALLLLSYARSPKPAASKAPFLTSAPAKADIGASIAIEGNGFAPQPTANTVRIGEQTAKVVQASPTRLTIEVPEGTGADASITVEVGGVTSNALKLRVSPVPRVTGLSPDVAQPGQEVTLNGIRLGGASPVVTVGNVPAEVLESRPDAIRIRIPAMPAPDGQSVPIVARIGDESSKPVNLTFGRLPLVMEVSPRRGLPGDRVTIKGRGFAAEPAGNVVTIGGEPALVVKAQPGELIVLIPALPGNAADAQIVVKVADSSSTPRTLGIEARSMAFYVPRFFAAAVSGHAGHGHVLVATEAGPLMLLTDKADAPSTVERAEKLATALNSLVEAQLRSEAVALEFRESGPSVALASGARSVLVTPTARDAAAYGETWESGVRPVNAAPRDLARYWTALLSDYFTLFLAKQRPTHVVELSPHARALLDLFAEAARRAGPGNGVPSALITMPGAMLARNLREMAFLLPTGGSGARASTAIEGTWEGTMRDGDRTRPVQLQLQSDGGRLVGTLTVRKGTLAIRAPMTQVSYERGTLTFVANVGGEERFFSATLQGDRLTGSIQSGSARSEKVGEISVRFTD